MVSHKKESGGSIGENTGCGTSIKGVIVSPHTFSSVAPDSLEDMMKKASPDRYRGKPPHKTRHHDPRAFKSQKI